jgi:hypothetical protein
MTLPSRAGRRALPAIVLLLATGSASAGKLVLPPGMGGVPDVGAIPCAVLSDMMRIGPLGTRHSLLTWTAGYLKALSGQSLQELVDAASANGRSWTYVQLGDDLVAYCAANPKAVTADAAANLAGKLGVSR